MGVPYSKEITLALNQVDPLVKQGIKVLDTTVKIAIVLGICQLLVIVLLGLVLVALLAILVTMNPDLAKERQAFVTPVIKLIIETGGSIMEVMNAVMFQGNALLSRFISSGGPMDDVGTFHAGGEDAEPSDLRKTE